MIAEDGHVGKQSVHRSRGTWSFYGLLASMRGQLFRYEDFAELYCADNGERAYRRVCWRRRCFFSKGTGIVGDDLVYGSSPTCSLLSAADWSYPSTELTAADDDEGLGTAAVPSQGHRVKRADELVRGMRSDDTSRPGLPMPSFVSAGTWTSRLSCKGLGQRAARTFAGHRVLAHPLGLPQPTHTLQFIGIRSLAAARDAMLVAEPGVRKAAGGEAERAMEVAIERSMPDH